MRFAPMRTFRSASCLLAACAALAGCRHAPEAPKAAEAAAAQPFVEDADVTAREKRPGGRPPVLWLGLDGLDFELLDRLAAEGKMGSWKRLAAEGYTARLESFLPLLSPILWTTAATGVGPDVHRVLDFQEVDSKTGRKVPISGFSREAPAVWNIASARGRRVGVVGWWASHPAEEVSGFFVSDRVSPILFDRLSLSGAAFPTSLEAGVAQVAGRDGRVSDADLARFLDVPASEIASARASGAGMENSIVALSRILAATRVSQRVARDLYDRERPQLLALYLEGTDEVGHIFALSTPPRLPCASEADIARYGRAVETYYGVVDRMLGQWMRRAEEDGATLLVHSDHGFKWGADRPCGFGSGDWKTAAFWHHLDGVFAAWGARVVPHRPRGEASLFDVAPTVLALLDLPGDRRMRGKPVAAAFRDLPSPAREDLSKLPVRRLEARAPSEAESGEFARKLRALGYLSGSEAPALTPTGGDRPGLTEGAWNNLGVYLRDTAKDPMAARKAFQKSLEISPDYYSPMFNLAVLERGRGDTKAAHEWFFRSLSAAGADPAPAVLGWAHEYQKDGKVESAKALLDRAVKTFPENEAIARELATLRYRSHDCRGATSALSAFERATKDPRTFNALALFATCRAERQEVIRLLQRSLVLDPNQPEVARTLSNVQNPR
jgi:predicted AlkP superfamily phosphohydrolase/phosphomutase/Tfp pilus assembly protein PilF